MQCEIYYIHKKRPFEERKRVIIYFSFLCIIYAAIIVRSNWKDENTDLCVLWRFLCKIISHETHKVRLGGVILTLLGIRSSSFDV